MKTEIHFKNQLDDMCKATISANNTRLCYIMNSAHTVVTWIQLYVTVVTNPAEL